jgi:hypothetical protein
MQAGHLRPSWRRPPSKAAWCGRPHLLREQQLRDRATRRSRPRSVRLVTFTGVVRHSKHRLRQGRGTSRIGAVRCLPGRVRLRPPDGWTCRARWWGWSVEPQVGPDPSGRQFRSGDFGDAAAVGTCRGDCDVDILRPYVVRRVVGPDGVVIQRNEPTVEAADLGETARVVRGLLRGVVESGTARRRRSRAFRWPARPARRRRSTARPAATRLATACPHSSASHRWKSPAS